MVHGNIAVPTLVATFTKDVEEERIDRIAALRCRTEPRSKGGIFGLPAAE